MTVHWSKWLKISIFSTLAFGLLSACEQQGCNPNRTTNTDDSNYCRVLDSELQPALAPHYDFPTSYQYLNGCFVYAVSHILAYKGVELNVYEAEKLTGKPREELWDLKHISDLQNAYHLQFLWSNSVNELFKLLAEGEPVLLQYLIPFEGETIGHVVAAYSFDEKGLWVSDSLKGKTVRLPYKDVFKPNTQETLLSFARVQTLSTP